MLIRCFRVSGGLGVRAANSLAAPRLKPLAVRHPGADPIPPAFAGQEPLGFDAGDFDEAEED